MQLWRLLVGAAGLGRGKRAKGDEHGGIDGTSVEQECADDGLEESSDFGFVELLAEVSSDLAMDDAVRRLMREDCGDAGGCVNIQNGVPSSGLK
jgi:hypothetical protein